MDDVSGGTYSIAAHSSDSPDANVVACGDMTGFAQNGTLLVQLSEVNSSGYEGRAALHDENGGVTVTIGVFSTGQAQPLGTPPASPAATPRS